MRSYRLLFALFALALSAGLLPAQTNQTNLPLGLPTDQALPLKLDGYKLVCLDRKKEVIFDIDGKRVPGEVPIFIYIPEADAASELKHGLRAIHSELARMSSQRDAVNPEKLMTLYLALDRLLAMQETLSVKPDVPVQPIPQVDKIEDSKQSGTALSPLERAIARKQP
jgi:hypothetical protein